MKELTRVETSVLIGGHSPARCNRLYDRAMGASGRRFMRLARRYLRNC